MIAIDIGCAKYGGDYSIERLIEEFHPDVLYGFDPSSSLEMYGPGEPFKIGDTEVLVERKAAWTYDGEIGFCERGLGGAIDLAERTKVPCFDLARFVADLPGNDHVLKIDAEGAEYELLEHLIATRTDALLQLAWIEWHVHDGKGVAERESIEARIACEMHQWNW